MRYIVFLLDSNIMMSCIEILIFVYSASAMKKICKEHSEHCYSHAKLTYLVIIIDVSKINTA